MDTHSRLSSPGCNCDGDQFSHKPAFIELPSQHVFVFCISTPYQQKPNPHRYSHGHDHGHGYRIIIDTTKSYNLQAGASLYQRKHDHRSPPATTVNVLTIVVRHHHINNLKLIAITAIEYSIPMATRSPQGQLKVVFDRNPTIFKTDADRVQYALRSMGEQTTLYFEPFLNKTIIDYRKCLSKYPVFLKTLRFVFGKPPTRQMEEDALKQLLKIQQTDAMWNYIKILRDLNAILRFDERSLISIFKSGISPELWPFFRNMDEYQTLSDLQVAASEVYATHTGQRIRKEKSQFEAAKWARQTQGINDHGHNLEQVEEPDMVNSQPRSKALTSTPDDTSIFAGAVPKVGPGVNVAMQGKKSWWKGGHSKKKKKNGK
ncbi:hypothetical protein BGZ96_011298 [Linnemannia gamsii]|uniref:Retrotransposon gag domain-containing protein n=1 Tax=Linnemannia gamsii TaxID=64522 RepID=A0ABQ7JSV5_9FUNG|nr:hypothetical protein BGZ96_011298 [Linnemannia gamsii]